MPRDHRVRQLLEALCVQRLVPTELRDAEIAQPGQRGLGTGSPFGQRLAATVDEKIDAQGDSFEDGLLAAARARSSGSSDLTLESRDARQNSMADALVQFLVRAHFAEIRTNEVGETYRYDIAVDWEALRRFAADNGIDLDEVVRQNDTAAERPG
jgi:hypothetical protein